MKQEILSSAGDYRELDACLERNAVKRLLRGCGKSIERLPPWVYFLRLPTRLGVEGVRFSEFSPNPTYEAAVRGVEAYHRDKCQAIVAVGGGSAMDVAKCIKAYSTMPLGSDYFHQPLLPNDVLLIAVPTTAGTGSEATRYAIINYRGEKFSITDLSLIPQVVLFDPQVLSTLPLYQRKVTMLDALCHGIESYWAVSSTPESRRYASEAIALTLSSLEAYLSNDPTGNARMLEASNLAGKAINITQTTAGHAMSYKLTGLFGLAHGHAVALCVDALWPFMLSHTALCSDPRGEAYLKETFNSLAAVMGCPTAEAAMQWFRRLVSDLSLQRPAASEEQHDILKLSVNPERLRNHPVTLTTDTISQLYHQMLR